MNDYSKDNPRFSVIVPIYNAEKYLRQNIESILSQDFKDYELILIDDGSTDKSGSICDEYREKNNNVIKVIHKANAGPLSARKYAAAIATGEYIICVDADDYIAENFLSDINDEIESDVDILTFGFDYIYNGLRQETVFDSATPGKYDTNLLEVIKRGYLYDKRVAHVNTGTLNYSIWSKCFKKDLYIRSQAKVNEGVMKGEDAIIILYALCDANCVKVTRLNGYFRRVHEQSMMHTNREDDFIKHELLIDEMLKRDDKSNITNDQIYLYCYSSLYLMLKRHIAYLRSYRAMKYLWHQVKESGVLKYIKKIEVNSGMSRKDRLKIFMMKKDLSLMLYVYVKTLLRFSDRELI